MSGDYEFLRYEVQDRIATISLDRPPVNAIHEAMTLEYFDALARADAEPEVRALVLRGEGRGLSAGDDLAYLESFGQAEMARFVELFYVQQVERVRALHKPIIASVHGFAREGACTMAFVCDMVICADDATFGYPGISALAAPPGMHVWILQRLIGRMRAAELILTGEPIDAETAGRLGLVTRVVPRIALEAEARALAGKLAALSPLALERTRSLVFEMEDMPFSQVPARAARAISEAFDSQDSREARRAFREKRPPVWQGR